MFVQGFQINVSDYSSKDNFRNFFQNFSKNSYTMFGIHPPLKFSSIRISSFSSLFKDSSRIFCNDSLKNAFKHSKIFSKAKSFSKIEPNSLSSRSPEISTRTLQISLDKFNQRRLWGFAQYVSENSSYFSLQKFKFFQATFRNYSKSFFQEFLSNLIRWLS